MKVVTAVVNNPIFIEIQQAEPINISPFYILKKILQVYK